MIPALTPVTTGWLLYVTVGTTAAESMNAAANIFLGQTEAPLLIAPFLPTMTKWAEYSLLLLRNTFLMQVRDKLRDDGRLRHHSGHHPRGVHSVSSDQQHSTQSNYNGFLFVERLC